MSPLRKPKTPVCPSCGRSLRRHCHEDGELKLPATKACDLWECSNCREYGVPGKRWVKRG